jgi:hypothetical protein
MAILPEKITANVIALTLLATLAVTSAVAINVLFSIDAI